MTSNISLRSAFAGLTLVIGIYLAWSAITGIRLASRLDGVRAEWQNFTALRSEKTRAQTELIRALGFDGFIHHYDDYILRRDPTYRNRAWTDLGIAKRELARLDALAVNSAERAAYDDLAAALGRLESNLVELDAVLASDRSAREILEARDLDYRRSERAVDQIARSLGTRSEQAADEKAELRFELNAALGFTGFIQHYKRYLILGREADYTLARQHLAEARGRLAALSALKVDQTETLAIADIDTALRDYADALETIRERTGAGIDPARIDAELEVDDRYASRGLDLLELAETRALEATTDAVAAQLAGAIGTVNASNQLNALFSGALIVLINLLGFIAVIRPIERASNALARLSEGDLDVEVRRERNDRTEVGQLEQALTILREHELERREAEAELRRSAARDPLTGLSNRGDLKKRYTDLCALARRTGDTIGIVLVDLDNFKAVNDTHGHHAGDEVLRNVGAILKSGRRETDIVARLGGDEFVVVLYAPGSKRKVAEIGADIAARCRELEPYPGGDIRIGASVGFVHDSAEACADLDRVLARADAPMYHVKRHGKGGVVDILDVTASRTVEGIPASRVAPLPPRR